MGILPQGISPSLLEGQLINQLARYSVGVPAIFLVPVFLVV